MDNTENQFFVGMSNFELNELILGYASVLNEILAIHVSIFSAYMIVAYVVGRKLDNFQLYAISVLYSVYSLQQTFVFFTTGAISAQLVFFITGDNIIWSSYLSLIIFLSSWLGSLFFMRHCRKENDT